MLKTVNRQSLQWAGDDYYVIGILSRAVSSLLLQVGPPHSYYNYAAPFYSVLTVAS